MANPFTAPTIGADYRASEPPDDDSAVAANAVSWSKHITKIATPLKTYIDSLITNTTAAFGDIFANTVAVKSTAYTVVAGDRGTLLDVSGTTTITLLAAATAGDGFVVAVRNTALTTNVTIDGNASETINGATTLVLKPLTAIILVADGTNWSALLIGTQGLSGFHAAPSADQTAIVTGTWTDFVCAVTYDLGGEFTSNTFTATATGEYLFTWGVGSETSMTDGKVWITRLYKNGTTEIARATTSRSGGAGAMISSGSANVRLTATDTVKIQVFHDLGSNAVADGDASIHPAWFSGTRIS